MSDMPDVKKSQTFTLSKTEMQYIVTAIDIGETADGHARMIGIFGSHKQAEDFVREDMKDVLATLGADDDTIVKWDAHEIWVDDRQDSGCIWDILEVDPGSATAAQEDMVSEAEDKADKLREPDEDALLEVVADSLRRQGYKKVVNQCGTVLYEHDDKEGSIYLDVTERDKEE
jgi:hypothetical protein